MTFEKNFWHQTTTQVVTAIIIIILSAIFIPRFDAQSAETKNLRDKDAELASKDSEILKEQAKIKEDLVDVKLAIVKLTTIEENLTKIVDRWEAERVAELNRKNNSKNYARKSQQVPVE